MSTFMGVAWIDLIPGADEQAALAALDEAIPTLAQQWQGDVLEAEAEAVELSEGRYRIQAWSYDNYEQLADLVVHLARQTGQISHAFIALDHDEYGAEHIVIDAADGTVRRAYHYYAYPRDEDTGEYYIEDEPNSVSGIAGIEEPAAHNDPGVLVDGPAARNTVAERYGVPVMAVDEAATADASAHEESGIIGGPCARWCDALGLAWPGQNL
jgi:uncharacterized protein YukE